MSTKDVLLQHLRVQLLRLGVVSGESLLRMGDKDAAVTRALQRAKDPGARARLLQADV